MRQVEDIEFYLLRSGVAHKAVGEEPGHMWVVSPDSQTQVVVKLAESIILFRCKVLTIREGAKREELFGKLLGYNVNDMIHGAYGVEGDDVLLVCTLRLENLDYNEFQGTIDDFSLALSNHLPELGDYAERAQKDEAEKGHS